jgi:cardiolipin synthase
MVNARRFEKGDKVVRVVCFGLWLLVLAELSPAHAIEKLIRKPIVADYSVEDPAFQDSIGQLLRAPLVPGNQVTGYVNGDQIFPAMLDAISEAKQTITFENFIWRSGKLSDRFIDALIERAQAGVKVHCIVDGFGGWHLNRSDMFRLKRGGVDIVKFNRTHWWNPNKWGHRTHRKTLVIDGRVGFTGGICIADEWLGNAESPHVWRDNEFKIEGPVVAEMQGVFMDNWIRTREEVLHGTNYFPVIENKGSMLAQCFKSGPQDGAENARLLYLYSIAAAQKTIRLSESYFVPDDLAIDMLVAAAARGVRIEVITPGIIDFNIVRRAARSRWRKLMDAGVRFYEYQPAKYHCKVMIVDDAWVTAGSVNFDDRSFRLNDECNIDVLDKDFAASQIRVFEADKAQSKRLIPDEFRKRPWYIRAAENFAALFRSQL